VREIRTPSSMSGKERRSDGLLGERGNERRRAPQAPPVLHATALLLDSTRQESFMRSQRRADVGASNVASSLDSARKSEIRDAQAENGRYANHETALMFPMVRC
jgi:hypothetical protein